MFEMALALRQELLLVLIFFVLLLIKIGSTNIRPALILNLVNILLLLNFVTGLIDQSSAHGSLFAGTYVFSPLLRLEKNILNLGTLIISLSGYRWLKVHEHFIELYLLMLSTLLGMFFMISAANFMIFYVGLELSGIPLAAMANFELAKRRSAEAAMKYIFSSAFSSVLLLFGISLIYGSTGSLAFSEIAVKLTGDPLQVVAFVLIFSAFAFKTSIVPFHLWTADVYEGAPIMVTAYFSVISKASVLFVLVSTLYRVFGSLAHTWYSVLFVLSIATMITGNLFAMRQTNLKRFLAFSSVSQVGFILVGISGNSNTAQASVIYFILVYMFSNLGAFAVISLLAFSNGRANVADLRGLVRSNPFAAWVLTISFFSLAGIPPVAGFFGKFFLLMSGASAGNYVLLVIAALNMIISFYYYLRIVRVMFSGATELPMQPANIGWSSRLAMVACLTAMIFIGVSSWVYHYIFTMVLHG